MRGWVKPLPQIQLHGTKKATFDIAIEKETLFGAQDVIGRNLGNSPIYEMPPTFDSTLEGGPSRKHGTLQQFFESCLSLVRDLEALFDIEKLLYHQDKTLKDFTMNSLQKRKARKGMRMNIQIEDYEVDSVILDLGSYVKIMTKKT